MLEGGALETVFDLVHITVGLEFVLAAPLSSLFFSTEILSDVSFPGVCFVTLIVHMINKLLSLQQLQSLFNNIFTYFSCI